MLEGNFEATIGRSACEASSATWNLDTNPAFSLVLRKTTKNFDGFGLSQDLPDVN
jgi:hypothetical protein